MTGRRRIVFDATPLALVVHRVGLPEADACRAWAERHRLAGTELVLPDIIAYEVRRELLRLGRATSVAELDAFAQRPGCSRLAVTETALRRAAELWADVRRRGRPTADRHSLDVDVILAAQVLTTAWDKSDVVVASGNVKHLSLFVSAAEWTAI